MLKDTLYTEELKCKHIINRSTKAQLLMANAEFKELIINHYFTDYVLELQRQMHDYAKDSEQFNEIVRKLDAISMTRAYFLDIIEQGENAHKELDFIIKQTHGVDND